MITTDRPPVGDGREDFDFLFGTWRVAARRLTDVLDPACAAWHEFPLTAEARPVLAGLGNQDSYHGESGPGGRPFDGMTLRLFDPRTRVWRIWWGSTSNPGHLDPPMQGRFANGRGDFHGRDRLGGHDIDVHFRWHVDGPDAASWAQSFSFDGGRSWTENFTMDFRRT